MIKLLSYNEKDGQVVLSLELNYTRLFASTSDETNRVIPICSSPVKTGACHRENCSLGEDACVAVKEWKFFQLKFMVMTWL